jgi:hypothetical protein
VGDPFQVMKLHIALKSAEMVFLFQQHGRLLEFISSSALVSSSFSFMMWDWSPAISFFPSTVQVEFQGFFLREHA